MSFSSPWAFLLLVLPALLLVMQRMRRVLPARPIPLPAAHVRVRPGPRRRWSWVVGAAEAAAFVVAVLALAGPTRSERSASATAHGIDIALVLDVSSSMQTGHLAENESRLAAAARVLDSFIARRADDRVALFTFAQWPRRVAPLTLDRDAVRELLRQVQPARPDTPEDATAVGTALAAAVVELARSEVESKVAILLTDGEENVNRILPQEAADLAVARGVKVFAVAAGTPRAAATRELDRLARATGGRGFVARDAQVLTDVYAEIDRLARVEHREEARFTVSDDHGRWLFALLALAILTLVGEAFLSRRAP